MFSYRHAFHAGNHADVLKHATLIWVLRHLTDKPVPLTVVDTHAGAGLYRLDSEAAQTSGEMLHGVQRLREQLSTEKLKDRLDRLIAQAEAQAAAASSPP